jgi:hypothetical protein
MVYELHSVENEPALDSFRELVDLSCFLSRHHRALNPKSPLSPKITMSGILDVEERLPYRTLSEAVRQWFEKSNLSGVSSSHSYTTHGFRRGSAQHRFFYSPRRLSWIKEWGRWSCTGRRDNALVHYFLEELDMLVRLVPSELNCVATKNSSKMLTILLDLPCVKSLH